jgi:hypothetical protein
MKSLPCRPVIALYLSISLLSAALVSACGKPAPQSPREELVSSLKGANVDGFEFATTEDDAQEVASLTSKAVKELTNMDSGPTSIVLRYTRVKDKKANTAKTFKAEMTRSGKELTLQVTDIGSSEIVSKNTFTPVAHDPGPTPRPQTFNTLEDCIRDFDCNRRGALQCEANRTCKDQFAALSCCLNNGQCFSVHIIVRPTSLRCVLISVVADFEGFVLTQ